ncbi:MAG: MaoC family dehydratase N-terminal domain-containing protein [Bifidobacteriaceae bacterium]|nr:MaoC family dehydratase N-terminal domain-containing protein [Bifidobacteriaceae bacterium]
MPVDPSFAGRVYPPAEPYLVGREKLREFARAVGATHPACFDPAAARALGYADVVAPPTFAGVIAQRAEAAYVEDPAAGIDFARVVHAEESIRSARPIVAGDQIDAALRVVSVRARRGLTLVVTEVALSDAVSHHPVAAVTSTLAVREDVP